MRTPYMLAIVLTVCLTGLCYSWNSFQPDPRVLPDWAMDASVDYSNILPADYVGTDSCADCHRKQHDLWKDHPHSCMNQLPNEQSVLADFDHSVMTLPAGRVTFTREEDRYWMTVYLGSPGEINEAPYRRYCVTRTVGSRYMQYFIGKQTLGPEEPESPIFGEHMLPFAFSLRAQTWYPRQYFDADGDEKLEQGVPVVEALNGPPAIRPYNEDCMNCHNTLPYAYRIFHRKLAGFVDATVATTVKPLAEELAHQDVHVDPSVADFERLNGRLDPDEDLVSMGIGCESCHFGGKQHAEQEKEIKFLPSSKFVRLRPHSPAHEMTNERNNPLTVLGICVQCHSGGSKKYPNGAAKTNSREAIDFHGGFCTSELRCIDCHEPHTAGQKEGLPDLPAHVNSCVQCHPQYEDKAAALAHSGHAESTGVNCLDCHMPKIAQGLEDLVRTHRIGNPVEQKMIAAGSANACNTCHLDKSTRWTLNELRKGWGVNLVPDRDWAVYAQLDVPVGELWIDGQDNHLRLLATQLYARHHSGENELRRVVESLNDPEPLNRLFASFAVRKMMGMERDDQLDVDITQPPAVRSRQIKQWLYRLDQSAPIRTTVPTTTDY